MHVAFIVDNNEMYGSVRMHQESTYSGRVLGPTLTNWDFTVPAKAYGAVDELVERSKDFAPAFEGAIKSGAVALLDVRTDPYAISTRTTVASQRKCASAS